MRIADARDGIGEPWRESAVVEPGAAGEVEPRCRRDRGPGDDVGGAALEPATDREAVVLVAAERLPDQAVERRLANGPIQVQADIGPRAALEPVDAGVFVEREQVLIGELEIEAVLVRDLPAAVALRIRGHDDLGNGLDQLRAEPSAVPDERPVQLDGDLRMDPRQLG